MELSVWIEETKGGTRRIETSKVKNDAKARSGDLAFRLATVDFGVDEDGDPVSAAYVEELPPLDDEPKGRKLKGPSWAPCRS